MEGSGRLTREQLTMLGTLAGRARDARSSDPVLGDRAAADAMDRLGADVRAQLDALGTDDQLALSVAARGRLLDRWVSDFLARHPDALVLHLGAGLDTRGARLRPGPGVLWYDLDQPDVIALRRTVLPPPDDRHRLIAGDLTGSDWLTGIPTDRPTIVVAEGLTMYLRPVVGVALFTRLADRFAGELVVDTYSRAGVALQWANRVVRRAGATLRWGIDDPADLERIGGLRVLESLDVTDMITPDLAGRLTPSQRRQVRFAGRIPALRTMGRLVRFRLGDDPARAAESGGSPERRGTEGPSGGT